jgi:hypothetical protein
MASYNCFGKSSFSRGRLYIVRQQCRGGRVVAPGDFMCMRGAFMGRGHAPPLYQ